MKPAGCLSYLQVALDSGCGGQKVHQTAISQAKLPGSNHGVDRLVRVDQLHMAVDTVGHLLALYGYLCRKPALQTALATSYAASNLYA